MKSAIARAVVIVAFPIVAFVVGVWVMSLVSGRPSVPEPEPGVGNAEDGKPLNRRYHYDVDAVRRHWGSFKDDAIAAEQRFLEVDLVFPFLYGGALAASLLAVWLTLGRPFSVAWLIVPVALAVAGDWTENLVQWSQLLRFIRHEGLQPGWITVASAGTLVKNVLLRLAFGELLVLVGVMVYRSWRSS